MWRIPLSLFGGGGVYSLTFTSDAYIGDLFTYLGSPSIPVEVTITADAADVGEVIITSAFDPASTFTFVGENGGRFVGTGGAGGSGGDDNGATGTRGGKGSSGGAAIASSFNIDLDIDDGFMLGGGGGGGGGSYDDTGAGGTPGGGGGGGIGWGNAAGGAAGDPTGTPIASAGTAGSTSAAGSGGLGGTSGTNNGGDGAAWGLAGSYGQHANPGNDEFVVGDNEGNGGAGGNGGSAFAPSSGAVITYTGAKTEATLRSESRIKGETEGNLFLNDAVVFGSHVGIGHPSRQYGFSFESDGDLVKINTDTGNNTTAWWGGNTVTGADYEVRFISAVKAGTWDTSPGADDAWLALSVNRTWTYDTAAAAQECGSIFEIRRTDETLPTARARLSAVTDYEP